MAYDLFFGKTKHNIARGRHPVIEATVATVTDEVTITFSDDEKAMLEKISILRMKADSGDKDAKKDLIAFTKSVAKLKAKAKKGDPKAKRSLLVLNESGIFNPTQQITILGFSLFSNKPDEHAKQRRREEFETEVTKLSTPAQITDFARIVAFNAPLQKIVQDMATRGSSNAINVLAASKAFNTNQPVAMRGIADLGWDAQRHALRKARRAARRAAKLNTLKSRAASGDQQAIARLQRVQQRLSAKAATGDQTAITRLQQLNTNLPATVTSQTQYPYTTPTAINAPGTFPNQTSSYPTSAYPTATYPTPSYGTTATPTYYQDADGNFYPTNPIPGQSQPTIDVYQGDSFGSEEAQALARDGGATERAALHRTSRIKGGCSFIGNAIPHENYRVAVMKAAVKSAGGGRPTTKDYFQAKAAVDRVIGKSGITIYMPGAKPGRRTI
jgi:hypothetical protein